MKNKKISLIKLTIFIGLNLFTPNLIVNALPLEQTEIINQDANLGLDEQLWGENGDKQALLTAINNSLKYINSSSAANAYSKYPVKGVTRDKVRQSLIRFRELLLNSSSATEFKAAIQREFTFYRAVGTDNLGTVHFTGYFEPVYQASRTPNDEYRYPLYRKPNNFYRVSSFTRSQIEGKDGLLGNKSPVTGQEIVWLKDRLEAFLIHVQGSARLKLIDGTTMSVGYDGHTNHRYVSIGRELINDGKVEEEGLSLPKVMAYFQENPQELDEYLSRNHRFIFFRPTNGAPPLGNLGFPVTANRSIATDKSIMPPGALALIHASIPPLNQPLLEGNQSLVSRYVLDQDTGSAIKGPGRVDIFMGTGQLAGDRAGIMNSNGQLYYLLLK